MSKKGTLVQYGNVDQCSHYENNLEIPQNIKKGIIMQSSNSTSEYIPKENENRVSKGCMFFLVYCRIIHHNQDMGKT